MMTKAQLISLLQCALDSAKCGDDELLDRCLIELHEDYMDWAGADTSNRDGTPAGHRLAVNEDEGN